MKTKKTIPFVKLKISTLNSDQLNIVRGGDDNGLKPQSRGGRICKTRRC
ncbi:hypothetical protein [Aquimarina aggregata]|nr:hypothetical protein [Aquimarina aggregata]